MPDAEMHWHVIALEGRIGGRGRASRLVDGTLRRSIHHGAMKALSSLQRLDVQRTPWRISPHHQAVGRWDCDTLTSITACAGLNQQGRPSAREKCLNSLEDAERWQLSAKLDAKTL